MERFYVEEEPEPYRAKRLKPHGLKKRVKSLDREDPDDLLDRLAECMEHCWPSRTAQDS
jgi:hypothetical protein